MEKSKDSNRVAIALICDDKDNVLVGIRNDNGLWTTPGGHIKVGEDPYESVVRELKEETGLDAQDVKLVKVCKPGQKMLYLFKVKVDLEQEIDVSQDPDKECENWFFVDPNDIKENLHVPLEHNIAFKYWCEN